MSDQGNYRYDVFISYSHQNGMWVQGQVLPRLENAGLRVCIDFRDFAIGVPSLINMERSVDNSQHTLLVLTPAWVASEWTEFESLLAGTSDPAARRRKLIPLMLAECKPPTRIAMLTWADFRDPQQHKTQFDRLISQLQLNSIAVKVGSSGSTVTSQNPPSGVPILSNANLDQSDASPASAEQMKSDQDAKMVSNVSQDEPMDTEGSSVHTDGGAHVGSNVGTGGGDFIGHNKEEFQGNIVFANRIDTMFMPSSPTTPSDEIKVLPGSLSPKPKFFSRQKAVFRLLLIILMAVILITAWIVPQIQRRLTPTFPIVNIKGKDYKVSLDTPIQLQAKIGDNPIHIQIFLQDGTGKSLSSVHYSWSFIPAEPKNPDAIGSSKDYHVPAHQRGQLIRIEAESNGYRKTTLIQVTIIH